MIADTRRQAGEQANPGEGPGGGDPKESEHKTKSEKGKSVQEWFKKTFEDEEEVNCWKGKWRVSQHHIPSHCPPRLLVGST